MVISADSTRTTSCNLCSDLFNKLLQELLKLARLYSKWTIERNADVLLNACKDISSAVNIGKTKYMEIERNRGMIANAHIKIGSNSYEKVKTFKNLGFIDKSKLYSGGNKMQT